MYRVTVCMRDADSGEFTRDYVQIEETETSLKLWETEDSWNVVQYDAMWFYFVQVIR